jgi:hypothetical protein
MKEKWKINDAAISICDAYLFLTDEAGSDTEEKIISKDQEFVVEDIKTLKCSLFLDVGISRPKSDIIHYYCTICREIHEVKTSKELNIYFPSSWFKKPDKNSIKEKIKKMLGLKKEKVESDKVLILKPMPKKPPLEIPKRFHEKKRNLETVE